VPYRALSTLQAAQVRRRSLRDSKKPVYWGCWRPGWRESRLEFTLLPARYGRRAQAWAGTILKSLDRLLASAATHILADSPSQLDFLRQQKVLASDRGSVLANGSISGVDVSRFKPDLNTRERIRRELSIPGHFLRIPVRRPAHSRQRRPYVGASVF